MTFRDLRPVISMSRAVSTTAPLADILATIARAAADLLDAEAAAILTASPRGALRYAADYGLSDGERSSLDVENAEDGALLGVFRSQRGIVITDAGGAEGSADRRRGISVPCQAMLALPLRLDDTPFGTLSVYRRRRGSWPAEALGLMELVAANAASAVRTAQRIDEQNQRISAHARLIRGLRAQTHDHIGQLVKLHDELDAGDAKGVSKVVSGLEGDLSEHYQRVTERIENRIVAGMLLGEASIARSRGVRFRLDARSGLSALPCGFSEFELVTILSNLLENAFDAVEQVGRRRRRTSLLIREAAGELRIRVQDSGVGLPPVSDDDLTRHGFTTKSDHSGIGLAIVAEMVDSRGGKLVLRRLNTGSVVDVVVPCG